MARKRIHAAPAPPVIVPTDTDTVQALKSVVEALEKLRTITPTSLAPRADREFYQRWLEEELHDK